jgi:hypothetical protein
MKQAASGVQVEAICLSETSVDFYRTTRRHIPEVTTLQLINKYANQPIAFNFTICTGCTIVNCNTKNLFSKN